jgi:hypothetical protein
MRAAIDPNDWPQRCAPSPESLMISTICSSRVTAVAVFFLSEAVCSFGDRVPVI